MKLKPYPSYKDSRSLWLGNVPIHWALSKLKIFSNMQTGSTPSTLVEENYTDEGFPWFRPEDISEQSSNIVATKFLSELGEQEVRKSRAGCTVLCGIGTIGKAAFADHDFSTNQQLIAIDSELNDRFCFYLILAARAELESLSTGNVVRILNNERLGSLSIPIVDLISQQQISNFLDRETGKLDTLISKQEKLIELINERIVSMVLGAIKSSDTKYIRLIYACDIISRPINQEEGSSFTRLGVLNRGRGLFKREEADSEDMGESDFFWVESGDLILSGQFAWEGSVAMADDEHEGCVVSHRFPIIRGKSGVVLTEYLLALFMTTHGDFLLNENSRGSAGRNRPLNMSLLLKEKIPIASLNIQNEVARLLRLQKKLKDKAGTQIRLLREHRTALISAAVTGKIDVREAA